MIHNKIAFAFIISVLLAAEIVSGDRRGVWGSPSFSPSEQALFGACSSEDCIFGSFSTGSQTIRLASEESQLDKKEAPERVGSPASTRSGGKPGDDNGDNDNKSNKGSKSPSTTAFPKKPSFLR